MFNHPVRGRSGSVGDMYRAPIPIAVDRPQRSIGCCASSRRHFRPGGAGGAHWTTRDSRSKRIAPALRPGLQDQCNGQSSIQACSAMK